MPKKTKRLPDDIEIDHQSTKQYKEIIDGITDDIALCEQKIQSLKSKKVSIGRQLLPWELLWDLFYNRNISSKDICDKFLIESVYEFKKLIGSCNLVVNCGICEKELRLTVTSREHLKMVKRGDTSYKHPGFHRINNNFLCDECYDIETQRHIEIRENEQKQFGIRLQELKDMDYNDYLRTSEWDGTRKTMLRRADYKCQLCNRKGQLNVHHKTYERLGEELHDDLIVLCAECHAKHHDKLEVVDNAKE